MYSGKGGGEKKRANGRAGKHVIVQIQHDVRGLCIQVLLATLAQSSNSELLRVMEKPLLIVA